MGEAVCLVGVGEGEDSFDIGLQRQECWGWLEFRRLGKGLKGNYG